MNVTIIVLELLIMFLAFGFLVFGLLLISPLTFISDYPPKIREAYYRTQKKEAMKEKLSAVMMSKKIIAIVAFMFIFAWMLHIAGAKTFLQGFALACMYAFALFAWDTFFLDWVLFANIKRVRLPGTEHMDKEYHEKWFHVKACFPMIPVFAVVAIVSSLILLWIW